jgi:uncharacterized protein YuzE
MKIEYDTEHDLLNIEFLANVSIDESLEVDGIVIDYAKDKRIVAIEVLDASKRTTRKPLDFINQAVVKSSGSDAVREKGAMCATPQPSLPRRGRSSAFSRASSSTTASSRNGSGYKTSPTRSNTASSVFLLV